MQPNKEEHLYANTEEEPQYADIEGDYTSVIWDDCQQQGNIAFDYHHETTTLPHYHHQDRDRGTAQPDPQEQRDRGQVNIVLPRHVVPERRCKQPPWWAWLLMVIGMVIVIGLAVLSVLWYIGTVAAKDCQQVYDAGHHTSGVYVISPNDMEPSTALEVFCEQQLVGGGWLVFQARRDGSVNFYQNWTTYKGGFGNLMGEFWLGNTNIHLLTKHLDQELLIELTKSDGQMEYANYRYFFIGDESQKYMLTVSGYSGGTPPGDSMSIHNGIQFSTKDKINPNDCASQRVGGWWYKDHDNQGCSHANLNAQYKKDIYNGGMFWWTWKPVSHLTATRMMMRRRS